MREVERDGEVVVAMVVDASGGVGARSVASSRDAGGAGASVRD